MEGKEASCHSCLGKVIRAEEACQASGNLYHAACFQCCSCGRTLKGKAFYSIHNRVYCEEDYNLSGLQEEAFRCKVCDDVIGDLVLHANGSYYHPGCFKCCVCEQWLTESQYTVGKDNEIYCIPDYHKVYAPKCDSCNKSILPVDGSTETVKVVAMDKYFHVDCYQCEVCGMQLTDEPDKRCYPLLDHLLCHNCHLQRIKSSRSRSSVIISGETSLNDSDRAPGSSCNRHNEGENENRHQPCETVRDSLGDLSYTRTQRDTSKNSRGIISPGVVNKGPVDLFSQNNTLRPSDSYQTNNIKNTPGQAVSRDGVQAMVPRFLVGNSARACSEINTTPSSHNQTSAVANDKYNSANVCDSMKKITFGNSFVMPNASTSNINNYSTTSLGRQRYPKVFDMLPAEKITRQPNSNVCILQQRNERFANYSSASLERRNATNFTNLSTFQPFNERVDSISKTSTPRPPVVTIGFSTSSLGRRRRRPEEPNGGSTS